MSSIIKLMAFGVKQVLDHGLDSAGDLVAGVVERYFTDHSQTLPRALARANDGAWQALGLALAGDHFLNQVQGFLAGADARSVRDQIRAFLDSQAGAFPETSDSFRQTCLTEWKQARQAGWLSAQGLSARELTRQAAGFRRYTDPAGLVHGATEAVGQVADALAERCPNLARLLRRSPPDGLPLLAAAFCFFFRREVAADPELARELVFDHLQRLTASQEASFAAVGRALTALGDRFDQVLDQLDRLEAGVLDLHTELERLGQQHLANAGEVRQLLLEVVSRLDRVGLGKGEVQPRHSLSIRSEDERQAVKQLLARFRQLSPGEQQQVPALLNGLGKLQVAAGDFAGAEQTFTRVTRIVAEPPARAEAHYNAYLAALEQQRWDDALQDIQQAAVLDPQRFAPFPLDRYQPQRILGAGGFGTAFLCLDGFCESKEVVIKTLHGAELERNPDKVFGEAHVLNQLRHPAIIGVQDCNYADMVSRARPYIVMDYFPGMTLEQFVRDRGCLAPPDLLAMARPIVQAMVTAHGQGILHRDLKPANVLVRRQGDGWQVKIIDFGLALRRSTVETSVAVRSAGATLLADSVAGTLEYAPPEQMGKLPGVRPGPYSDVYSFGKLCCFALFDTTEPKSRHWQKGVAYEQWRTLLERCTEKDVHLRPGSFTDVAQHLEALGREKVDVLPTVLPVRRPPAREPRWQPAPPRPVPVCPEPPVLAVRPRSPAKQRGWLLWLGLSLTLTLALGICGLSVFFLLNGGLGRNQGSADPRNANSAAAGHDADVQIRLDQAPTPAEAARVVIDPERQPAHLPLAAAQKTKELILQETPRAEAERAKEVLTKRFADQKAAEMAAVQDKDSVRVKPDPKTALYEQKLADDQETAHKPPVAPTPKANNLVTVSLGSGSNMKFAWVPPGEFWMGDPGSQHKVTLTKGFYMGTYPVTQEQWLAVMGGDNPSHFNKGGAYSVEQVSWEDCQKFLKKLREREGKEYRLPTEAEWEFACRAGTTTAYYTGDGEEALKQAGWYAGNSDRTTHPVGQKAANKWGLYDMHGNVWQWCEDWYGDYPDGPTKDPKSSSNGKARVMRGGSWSDKAPCCSAANRGLCEPGGRSNNIGVRVVLVSSSKTQ